MLVRFFSHGNTKGDMRTRGGDSAKNYLLGVENAPRDGARLLKGDPSITTEIINGSTYRQVYTSGVLSFAPDERKLTDAQKQEIIESFEQTLFVGLETGQYSGYWVEHSDKERQELHFVFANIELTTGKALPVYYHKTDLRLVDSWKTLTNQQYGLHDPNDPKFKRDFAPSHDVFTKADLAGIKETKDIKKAIHDVLLNQVATGAIKDRQGITQFLETAGFEIARQSKDSISIKNPNGGKNLKFKGEIYDRDFQPFKSTADVSPSPSTAGQRIAGVAGNAPRIITDNPNPAEQGITGATREPSELITDNPHSTTAGNQRIAGNAPSDYPSYSKTTKTDVAGARDNAPSHPSTATADTDSSTNKTTRVLQIYQECLSRRKARHTERYCRPPTPRIKKSARAEQKRVADEQRAIITSTKTVRASSTGTNQEFHQQHSTAGAGAGRVFAKHDYDLRDPSEQQLTASSTDFEQLLQPVQDKLPRNPSENWQKPRSEHHQQYQAQQKTNNFDNHLASNTIGEPSNHAIFKLTNTIQSERNQQKTSSRTQTTPNQLQQILSVQKIMQETTTHERYSTTHLDTFTKLYAGIGEKTTSFFDELRSSIQNFTAKNGGKRSQEAFGREREVFAREPSSNRKSINKLTDAHRELTERFKRLRVQNPIPSPRNGSNELTGANRAYSELNRQFERNLRAIQSFNSEYDECRAEIRRDNTPSQRNFKDFTSRARASTTAMASISELSRNYQDTASTVNHAMQQLTANDRQLRDAKATKAEKERIARLEAEQARQARLEAERQEKLEKERLEAEKARLQQAERERLERLEAEKEHIARLEAENKQKQELQRQIPKPPAPKPF
jgi:hypothetical protein